MALFSRAEISTVQNIGQISAETKGMLSSARPRQHYRQFLLGPGSQTGTNNTYLWSLLELRGQFVITKQTVLVVRPKPPWTVPDNRDLERRIEWDPQSALRRIRIPAEQVHSTTDRKAPAFQRAIGRDPCECKVLRWLAVIKPFHARLRLDTGAGTPPPSQVFLPSVPVSRVALSHPSIDGAALTQVHGSMLQRISFISVVSISKNHDEYACGITVTCDLKRDRLPASGLALLKTTSEVALRHAKRFIQYHTPNIANSGSILPSLYCIECHGRGTAHVSQDTSHSPTSRDEGDPGHEAHT